MGEMITIELSHYQKLLEAAQILADLEAREDAADLEAVRRSLAETGESVPDSVMGRLLSDENRVLIYREWRGYTVSELARRAGLHRVQVHDIETGKRKGSVATLKKIAGALNRSLDDIA